MKVCVWVYIYTQTIYSNNIQINAFNHTQMLT